MRNLFFVIASFFISFNAFGTFDNNYNFDENPFVTDVEIQADLCQDFYGKVKKDPKIAKNNSVVLFTNARNEKNIKEWAAHHLLIGFDLVFIFDHKSDVPLINIFKNFDSRVIVERCEWENPVKMPLMERAVFIAKRLEASWMLYLDADEFLILNDFKDVKKLVKAFPHADALGVNWLLFGSNNHVNEPEGLILDNYTRSNLKLDDHIKTFVRPKEVTQATNPHFFHIKNSKKTYSIDNRVNPLTPLNKWSVEYFKAPAYVAHYIFQSEETYTTRKLNLPRDDLNAFRNKIPDIHLLYNEVENLSPKQKYADQVRLFLQKY